MVLESLTNPREAETHPAWLILYGAGYTTLALLIGLWLFPTYASMVTIFFICAASIPLLYNIIKYEEDKDMHYEQEKILIKEHGKAITAYFMLFIGITIALTIIFLLLQATAGTTINLGIMHIDIPNNIINTAFKAQIETYQAINPTHTVTGAAASGHFFSQVFLNNMKVLIFCVLFSFLYGAGAIFILTWNASIIALAIGNKVSTEVASIAGAVGLTKTAAYFQSGAHSVFLRYGIHGSLEIIAYIIAGLAGGIISVAAIKHHFKTRKFEHIVLDSADLLLLAIAILFLAGITEAYITPIFYT